MMIYSTAATTATNTTTPGFWFTAYKREVARVAAVNEAFDELAAALRNFETYLHELAA